MEYDVISNHEFKNNILILCNIIKIPNCLTITNDIYSIQYLLLYSVPYIYSFPIFFNLIYSMHYKSCTISLLARLVDSVLLGFQEKAYLRYTVVLPHMETLGTDIILYSFRKYLSPKINILLLNLLLFL